MLYTWLKFFHLLSAFCWMAGLFYLPRLFVYHTQAPADAHQLFQTMEKRLYKMIILPASCLTIVFGGLLWFYFGAGLWLHAKLMFVLALIGFQHLLNRYRCALILDPHFKSPRFFKIINEIPTLLLMGILYLAIFKPF